MRAVQVHLGGRALLLLFVVLCASVWRRRRSNELVKRRAAAPPPAQLHGTAWLLNAHHSRTFSVRKTSLSMPLAASWTIPSAISSPSL